MRKIYPFIVPILILIIGVLIIYFFLYKNLDFSENPEKPLALLLSAIGLVFGLFQVVLNINIQTVRNKAQLRHTEYKELGRILNSISELLNENMIKELNIHGLVNSLLNKVNEYISFIDNNSTYLFPDIQKSKIATATRDELNAILVRTDKFRKELENDRLGETDRMILEMNWHIEVRENLIRFNDSKSKLLKEVQTYFR